MKMTPVDSSVLGGQGSIGSYVLTAANPAPGIGPQGGGSDGDLSVQVSSPEAIAATHNPSQGIFDTPGGPHTIDTQYDTIKPIPEG
jgi:hypothetical protein